MSTKYSTEEINNLLELQQEIEDNFDDAHNEWLQAFVGWRKGEKSQEELDAALDNLRAVETETLTKDLIAHIPEKGERKVSNIIKMVAKLRRTEPDTPELERWEARLQTLASVNDWRESLGLPLLDTMPKGVMGNSQDCTIAQAMKWKFNNTRTIQSLKVDGNGANIYWTDTNDELNEWGQRTEHWGAEQFSGMNEVMTAFDSGWFPDLLEDEDLIKGFIQVTTSHGMVMLENLYDYTEDTNHFKFTVTTLRQEQFLQLWHDELEKRDGFNGQDLIKAITDHIKEKYNTTVDIGFDIIDGKIVVKEPVE